MSKYSEVVDKLNTKGNDLNTLTPEELDILVEMIDKAEKYDLEHDPIKSDSEYKC